MARKHTPEEIVRKLLAARESSLFIVVEGEGAVLSEGAAPREVSAGTTVWWEQGETPRDSL